MGFIAVVKRIALLTLTIIITASVQAHLEGGTHAENNGFALDVGYNHANLTTNTPTVFLVFLQDPQTGKTINSSSAWISLRNNEGSVFNARLVPEATGGYTFTTSLPSPGGYELIGRFETREGQRELVANLVVLKKPSLASELPIITLSLLIITLCITGFTFIKRKRGAHP